MRLPVVSSLEGSIGLVVDPCERKDRCVVVYVTPWCPACKSAVGFIQDFRSFLKNNDRVGLKIVVGADSGANIAEMAKRIGGTVYLDPKSQYKRALGVSGVPAWVVWDRGGKILERTAGAPPSGMGKRMVKLFMEQYLKLGSYF